MRALILAAGIAGLLGFSSAWYVQDLRAKDDIAQINDKHYQSALSAWALYANDLQAVEDQKEKIQNEYAAFVESEKQRDRAIDTGARRVYVRASCPLPTTEADTSGTQARTSELDPAYRRTLSQLRAAVEEQRRLLNICRAELFGGQLP